MSGNWFWGNNELGKKWNALKWYYKMIIIILELVILLGWALNGGI